MQCLRLKTRWKFSNPSRKQPCLPLPTRRALQQPRCPGSRQFSSRRAEDPDKQPEQPDESFEQLIARFGHPGKWPKDQLFKASKNETLTNELERYYSRVQIFPILPLPFRGPMPRLLITYKEPMSKETIGRWRRAIWLYRIAWLVGIGYLINTYILSDSTNSKGHAIFDAPRFVPFSIVAREDVSPTSFILTLRPSHGVKPGVDPYADEWDKGTWSVEFKQPQLQIARSYTPLPPSSDVQDPGDLRFLIRKERGGEVSNYLARLPVGGKVEIRGPHPEIDLPRDITDVVFLAGGTGIAPAMQVAYTLLDKRTGGERPRIHIVWANRKREDCVGGTSSSFAGSSSEDPLQSTGTIVRELKTMQNSHPGHLSVDYLVDEEGTFLDQTKISALTTGISQSSASAGSKLIFVSGPEGFINVLAGPKKWEDGEEKQGEVGGVIGRMGVTDWKVWKL